MRLLAALFAFVSAPAGAADIAVALTDDVVEVDAGFTGARLVLFGALAGAGADELRPASFDIVAVVRGPAADFAIRRMQREGVIWTQGPAAVVAGAPSILLTSATRPLEDFTTPALRRELGLGAGSLDFVPLLKLPAESAEAGEPLVRRLVAAFIESSRAEGRYSDLADAVRVRKGALFSIDVVLPPTTPVGRYDVDVYLISEALPVSHDRTSLVVRRVGVEERIYDLAHSRPVAYGIGCVLIALAAGWLAAAAFRK